MANFDFLYKNPPRGWHPPMKLPAKSSGSKVSTAASNTTLTGTPSDNSSNNNSEDWGDGGGGSGWSAQAAANAAARAQSEKQNDLTRQAAQAKYKLFASFDKALNSKLANITAGLAASDSNLLSGYATSLRGLENSREDNEKAEADSSFANLSNALRERGEILGEVASQGAGETDLLKAQLSALRNYDTNQSEINRSYFDTLSNVNRAVNSLNVDTITNRKNIYDKAEDDRDTAYTNYYNQYADTWNEIFNIESSNTNVDSDTSVAYTRLYGSAADEAARNAGRTYAKKTFDPALAAWEGQDTARKRDLTSNKAQVINLGEKQKRPEGATLRKWE